MMTVAERGYLDDVIMPHATRPRARHAARQDRGNAGKEAR